MPASNTQQSRPREASSGTAKSQQVLAELQAEILEGRFEPGRRLPTFDQMTERFGVSRAVLQAAVGKLKRDGFVRSVHRRGLFVAEKPPHLHRYGIVFPMHPEERQWSRINLALVNEASKLERSDPSRLFKLYTGLADESGGRAVRDAILKDVSLHRLAGLILMPGTYDLIEQIRPRNAEIPLVTIFAAENWGFKLNITVDRAMFYRRAVGRLTNELGRKRLAVVNIADTVAGINLPEMFAKAGTVLRDQWDQVVARSHPEATRRLISLLMDYPVDQRPDGLIIGDDNLIEHAAAGLAGLGIRVGEELSVVAHTNWPWPYSSVLPMDRLGYNATEILRLAIQTIRDHQEGRSIPCDQFVPAQFEWELKDSPYEVEM